MKCISFSKTFLKISCVAWSLCLAQNLVAQNPTQNAQKENIESQSSTPEYIPQSSLQSALQSTLEPTLDSALDSSLQDSKIKKDTAQKDTTKEAAKENTKAMTQEETESSSNSSAKSNTQENAQSKTSKNEKSEKKDDTRKFGNIFKSQKLDSTSKADLKTGLQSSQASSQASTQSNESFITPQEYGASLYEYPRGIGCIKCHGAIGEETLLATYTHKGKQKTLLVPRINNLELFNFKTALTQDKGIMPKYNLTDEEIQAIYLYISSKNPTRVK